MIDHSGSPSRDAAPDSANIRAQGTSPGNSASKQCVVAQAIPPVPAATKAPKIDLLHTKKFYIAAAALFAANVALLAGLGYLINRIDEYQHNRKGQALVAWGKWLGREVMERKS
ncbi:hypothetical protein LTR56_015723 [Elasticomyces elasticus]|nr:hypothetical protein LTR56_015723 [Elasticomyces elasticus]KAK3659246.1 hypothetical protein LTR22_008513 [Elasticomyces elasticus]KAK4914772.1 hypothetical protein LTR49_017007 [Elasticomyces elasticus]KAK5754242.1 hypothetical protein LTS12_015652 [Elasticomyces elasticus]